MITYLKILILVLFGFTANASDIKRDPFMPFKFDKPKATSALKTDSKGIIKTPLTDKPLNQYVVAGTIISPTKSIALVRLRDNREFYVYAGDKLGIEGGVVDVISSEGITLDVNGKVVDVSVSNRFGVTNE